MGPTFDEIYETYRPRTVRYLARLVGEAEAEDLAQEVFVKVSRGLGGFREESQLVTWIYRIATNTALDRLRGPSSKEIANEPGSMESIEGAGNGDPWMARKRPSVEQQAIREEMTSCIHDVIHRLPEHYRTAIVLSDLEGFKDVEIADILGTSLPAAKITLHRARKALRQELSKCCVFYRNEENELACDRKPENR